VKIDVLLYLDPGSGSAIVQAVIAGLAAAALGLKIFWHRILRALGLKKTPKPKIDSED